MKKTRSFLIIILSLMTFLSCADDNEFHNLIGTWIHPPLSTAGLNKFKSGPPSYDCEKEIYITFDKSLTGKHDTCYFDNEEINFHWSIKGDQLTLVYDQQNGPKWDPVSGVNTFEISGDILTITNEDGTITQLQRQVNSSPNE